MDDLEKSFDWDDEPDPVLCERYRRIKEREAQGEPLADWDADLDALEASLRNSSGSNAAREYDIGERYRQYQRQKMNQDS